MDFCNKKEEALRYLASNEGNNYKKMTTKDLWRIKKIKVNNIENSLIYISSKCLECLRTGGAALSINIRSKEMTPIIILGEFSGHINLTINNSDCLAIFENIRQFNIGATLYENSIIFVKDSASSNSCSAILSDSEIIIGKDCMLSHDIILQSCDQHDIIDIDTGNVINKKRSIYIDDHVWIGKGSYIGAGVKIGSGSIIGAKSVVVKNVDQNTISAGNPAMVIKNCVSWKRSFSFLNKNMS